MTRMHLPALPSPHLTQEGFLAPNRSIVFTRHVLALRMSLTEISAELCIEFLPNSCSVWYQKHVIIHQMELNKNTTRVLQYTDVIDI